jgi:uncharacterized repeat protein (TIGR02543 family)
MMKRVCKKSFIVTLAASLLILGACNNILSPPQLRENRETGTVYIDIDGKNTGARTLVPALNNFTRYKVSFSGPEIQADEEILGVSGRTISLVAGDWTITVKAYTGTEGDYTEAGQGRTVVTVVPGESAVANITITPVGDGQGNLSYSVSFPRVNSGVLSLTNMHTDTLVEQRMIEYGMAENLADTLDLESGYYLLKIRLERNGKYAGRTEVVYIYNGHTTNAEYVFTEDEFVDEVNLDTTVNLVDGAWTDGNMTVSGEEYYWFNVIAGASYTVSWNDYNTDPAKVDIVVSAYYDGDGDLIFNRADYTQTFIAAFDGTVIIRVEPFNAGNTGAYSLRFTTDTSSPTVYFVVDGLTVHSETVQRGGSATPPETPRKEGYTFIGWDGDYTNVTEDRIITAIWEGIYYIVTFVDGYGGTIATYYVQNGESVDPPEAPWKEGYTFIGWDSDYTNVTEDRTITAMWEGIYYIVTFVDGYGGTIVTYYLQNGDSVDPPEAPWKEGYTFIGWSGDYTNVTEDRIITAMWQENIPYYFVNFVVDDWTVYSESVQRGGSATPPENPWKEGYIFIGWDSDYTNVTEDRTITAMWDVQNYTVYFVVDDWTVHSETVQHWGSATPPENPWKEGYTFIGWDSDYTNVTEDRTITAMWQENVQSGNLDAVIY